jgi:nucleotide-binding universal stress UspA family protein
MSEGIIVKRILVGVDGSETAEKALRFATEIAAPFHAELVVLYVVSPPVYPAEIYPIAFAEIEKEAKQFGQTIVQRALESIAKAGVTARAEVVPGSPAETIADAGERLGADLVAVGSRGLGAVKRVFLGSTSDRLIHICKRPVLVVR